LDKTPVKGKRFRMNPNFKSSEAEKQDLDHLSSIPSIKICAEINVRNHSDCVQKLWALRP